MQSRINTFEISSPDFVTVLSKNNCLFGSYNRCMSSTLDTCADALDCYCSPDMQLELLLHTEEIYNRCLSGKGSNKQTR